MDCGEVLRRRASHKLIMANKEARQLRGRRGGGAPAEGEDVFDPVIELETHHRSRLP